MAHRVVRTACAGVCAGFLAGALAWAQASSQQQPPPPQQRPTFRDGAVLVTVDAYPRRSGRIVEGLTAADFEVIEDGVPQRIENFEFVRIEPSLSESERKDPNTRAESYALAADPHNRVFVVFLDTLHVTVEGSHTIRRPLVDTLNRIIAPNDLFGVLTLHTAPKHLVLGRRLLTVEEQLTKYWTWGDRYRLGTDPTDPMEDVLEACFTNLPIPPYGPWYISDNGQQRYLYQLLIDRRREDRTLSSLELLVEHLASLREARTVLFLVTDGWRLFRNDQSLAGEATKYGPRRPPVGVSGGGQLTLGDPNKVQVNASECTAELLRLAGLDNDRRHRDLIERANRANVSFYPVTPNGLAVFDTPISEKSRPSLQEDGNRLRGRVDGLRTLAENTDGLAIVNINDLGAGMRRIVDDVSAYYLLGYYSTNTRQDGKFRRIEVNVRTPGLEVRARRGYVATVPASERPAEDRAAAADAADVTAALAPLSRLSAAANMFTRAAIDGDIARVTIELAASRAAATPWRGGADVQVVISGLDGRALPPVSGRLEPGTRSVQVSAPLSGLTLPVRVTTRIAAGGEVLDDGFEVPARTSALLGDAVLFRSRPAPTAPLQPVADPRFYRTERLHAEWTLETPVDQRTARLLGRDGRPLPVPVAVTVRQRDGRAVLAAGVSLAPLTGGDYLIELSVTRGPATERTLVAFRVVQ